MDKLRPGYSDPEKPNPGVISRLSPSDSVAHTRTTKLLVWVPRQWVIKTKEG